MNPFEIELFKERLDMPFLELKAFHKEEDLFRTKEVYLGGTLLDLQDEFEKE
jgi:hypothetical protein